MTLKLGTRARWAVAALVALGTFGSAPAAFADVTAVKGSAYGYSCVVSVFGMSCSPAGPTPTVTLASDASNSPQTASAASARADAGPATIFSSGRLDISTQGTLGPTGSVTSSSSIANVNASGNENFTASNLASTCTASGTGVSGSTTITGGTLLTDNGDSDPTNTVPDHAAVTVTLPTSPVPNTTYTGHVHIGNTTDSFRYVFNEQILNLDGSLTVNAAHQYLIGPLAVGDVIIGQSVCGVTAQVAVTFRSLTAARSANGVQVRWRTASEIDTLGFNVYREVNSKRVRVNTKLIATKGAGSYSYLDRSAPRSKVASYWIQVVNLDGSRQWHGPARVGPRA